MESSGVTPYPLFSFGIDCAHFDAEDPNGVEAKSLQWTQCFTHVASRLDLITGADFLRNLAMQISLGGQGTTIHYAGKNSTAVGDVGLDLEASSSAVALVGGLQLRANLLPYYWSLADLHADLYALGQITLSGTGLDIATLRVDATGFFAGMLGAERVDLSGSESSQYMEDPEYYASLVEIGGEFEYPFAFSLLGLDLQASPLIGGGAVFVTINYDFDPTAKGQEYLQILTGDENPVSVSDQGVLAIKDVLAKVRAGVSLTINDFVQISGGLAVLFNNPWNGKGHDGVEVSQGPVWSPHSSLRFKF